MDLLIYVCYVAAVVEDHSQIQLPEDWQDFDVFSKRKVVIALVTNNGSRHSFIYARLICKNPIYCFLFFIFVYAVCRAVTRALIGGGGG